MQQCLALDKKSIQLTQTEHLFVKRRLPLKSECKRQALISTSWLPLIFFKKADNNLSDASECLAVGLLMTAQSCCTVQPRRQRHMHPGYVELQSLGSACCSEEELISGGCWFSHDPRAEIFYCVWEAVQNYLPKQEHACRSDLAPRLLSIMRDSLFIYNNIQTVRACDYKSIGQN